MITAHEAREQTTNSNKEFITKMIDQAIIAGYSETSFVKVRISPEIEAELIFLGYTISKTSAHGLITISW